MAAAYDRALKRVNAVSEAVLAELIERDVQQLTERALGVLRSAQWTPSTAVPYVILVYHQCAWDLHGRMMGGPSCQCAHAAILEFAIVGKDCSCRT